MPESSRDTTNQPKQQERNQQRQREGRVRNKQDGDQAVAATAEAQKSQRRDARSQGAWRAELQSFLEYAVNDEKGGQAGNAGNHEHQVRFHCRSSQFLHDFLDDALDIGDLLGGQPGGQAPHDEQIGKLHVVDSCSVVGAQGAVGFSLDPFRRIFHESGQVDVSENPITGAVEKNRGEGKQGQAVGNKQAINTTRHEAGSSAVMQVTRVHAADAGLARFLNHDVRVFGAAIDGHVH